MLLMNFNSFINVSVMSRSESSVFVRFDEPFMLCLSRVLVRRFVKEVCLKNAYKFIRKTLEWVHKDASQKGMPLEVREMSFANGSKTNRRRPFIRIFRRSLEVYLKNHFIH